jgi:glycosyltransferase involved in cell wall biosynthesis
MIQYMAVGIPVVAEHTEINATVVEEGVNGYLVKTPTEWVERLSRLLDDAALRQRLGEAGRQLVEARFALERQAETLAKVLRGVAGS